MSEYVACECGWSSAGEAGLRSAYCPECGAELLSADSPRGRQKPVESSSPDTPDMGLALSEDEEPAEADMGLAMAEDEETDNWDDEWDDEEAEGAGAGHQTPGFDEVSEESLIDDGPPPLRSSGAGETVEKDPLADLDEFGNRKSRKARGQEKRTKKRQQALGLLRAEMALIQDALAQKRSVSGSKAASRASHTGGETPEDSEKRETLDRYRSQAAEGKGTAKQLRRREWALETVADESSPLPEWVNNFGAALIPLGIVAAASLIAFLLSLASLVLGLMVFVAGVVVGILLWRNQLRPVQDALRDYPAVRPRKKRAFSRTAFYWFVCGFCGVLAGAMLLVMILVAVLA